MRDSHGHCRFTDATRSHDADEPPTRDLRAQGFDGLIATDHSLQACGQGLHSGAVGRGTRRLAVLRQVLDRCNKAIAPAGYGGDVARTVSTITERSAEPGNMDPKTGLLDGNVRPSPFDQFLVAHDLSCPLDQSDQDVESTATQRHRLVVFHQQSFGRNQPERPELEHFRFVKLWRQRSDLAISHDCMRLDARHLPALAITS
jgi:hypothetical protein